QRLVADPVRIVDVMPTALEALGGPVPGSVQGKRLLGMGRGERESRIAYPETFYPRYHFRWSELKAIDDGRYKLISAPRPELYDLQQDPGESDDLALREPVRTSGLQRALGAHEQSEGK